MKAFRFRLEPVLRMRRIVVEQRRRLVAERMAQIRDVELRIRRLEQAVVEQTTAARTALAAASLEVQQVIWDRHHLAHLRRAAIESLGQLDQHRATLVQERKALAEALKGVRVLEKLEERQRLAHAAEVNRREQVETDERNTLRHVFALAQEAR